MTISYSKESYKHVKNKKWSLLLQKAQQCFRWCSASPVRNIVVLFEVINFISSFLRACNFLYYTIYMKKSWKSPIAGCLTKFNQVAESLSKSLGMFFDFSLFFSLHYSFIIAKKLQAHKKKNEIYYFKNTRQSFEPAKRNIIGCKRKKY